MAESVTTTQSVSGQSMWSDKVEYVMLEKADKGLGFSILDYQVSSKDKQTERQTGKQTDRQTNKQID